MAENSGVTAKRGRGRPFTKGKSGNPGGRPKRNPEIKAILRAASTEAAEELARLIHSADPRVALAACREILDRTEGKPVQASEVQMDMSGGMDLRAEVRAALLEGEQVRHGKER